MNRFYPVLLITFGLLFCCGCEPEERFSWSPDGSRAAVIIEDRLHLVDKSGRLLGSGNGHGSEEEESRSEIQAVEWLRDGTGLVVHRVKIGNDWEALRDRLPEAEVSEVEALAVQMPRRLESAAIFLGSDAELGDIITRLSPRGNVTDLSAFQLACSRDREAIKSALVDAPTAQSQLEEVDEEAPGFPVHELSVVPLTSDRSGFAEDSLVLRSLRGIRELVLAPDGTSVAVGRQTEDPERFDLEIIRLADGSRREVAKGVAPAFAWSQDGEGLVYLESLSEKGGHLMRLMQHSLKAEDEVGSRHLATVLIPFSPRVAVLPDDSILFAGQPIVLPASGRDPGRQPRLFRLSMPDGEIREIPTRPGALPMDLGTFVPAPDGSRVAIVESGSDAVAIVDLETGESELVLNSHPGWKCRTLPAWQDSETLSYAVLAEDGKRIDWVLRKESGEIRRLNSTWPEDATSGWLDLDRNERSGGGENSSREKGGAE